MTLSTSVRNRDPACTGFHSELPSVDFWRSTNPIPNVLASVRRRVSLVVSRNANVGENVSAFFAFVKASSWGWAHRKSFRVLSSGLSGDNISAIFLVLDASWFTRPMKERRSVWLLGVGSCAMASMMSLLIEYPTGVRVKPAKCAFCWQNWNLSRFRDIYFSSQRHKICRTCYTCFRRSLSKMITSSTILRKSSRSVNASSILLL